MHHYHYHTKYLSDTSLSLFNEAKHNSLSLLQHLKHLWYVVTVNKHSMKIKV